jgi:plastocyanin
MVGMMAAMVQGMTIGLGIGTLFAIWLPGEFFHATVFSMFIGGAIGAASGSPISLMAVLDGLLSGIMAGMMGTMFMVMIPATYSESALIIIAVLGSGSLFLLFLMLQNEVTTEHLQKRSFLLSKPGSMFAVISLFAVIIYLGSSPHIAFDKQLNNATDPHTNHQHRSEKELPVDNNELVIKATEFSFTPSTISINANEQVKIIFQNNGTIEHHFEIIGTNIHIHASPGQTSSTFVTLEKTGEYQAVCTLPGHEEAGMMSIVHVRS